MNVVGFFCEDLRPETAGSETIVGVLPDHMEVPPPPGAIPKIGVYIRIYLDLSEAPQSIVGWLKTPWGDIALGGVEKPVIDQALREARKSNLPYAGLVTRAMIAPFHIKAYGLVTAMITVDGVDHVCGILNLKEPTEAAASVSEPPASQSPTSP